LTGEDYGRPAPEAAPTHGSDAISLAQILAILWRRRAIVLGLTLLGLVAGVVYGLVVTPLYRGTAQVRPGITAFGPQGGPIRGWQLKDITHWYDSGLYAESVAGELGIEPADCPLIEATFIPRGMQNLQGGNVITLSTLVPDQQQARTVLEASIRGFDAYSRADSTSNALALTEGGLRLRMDGLRNDLARIDTRHDLLGIEIEKQKAMLADIEIESKLNDIRYRRLRAEVGLRNRGLDDLEEEIAGLREDHTLLQEAAGSLTGDMLRPMAPDSTGAAAPLAGQVLGDILAHSTDMRSRMRWSEIMSDSLSYQNEITSLNMDGFLLRSALELEQKRLEISSGLIQMEIERDQTLDQERRVLENEIRSIEVQLGMLASLEKIGATRVTEKPVRPRKARAAILLTIFGLFASIGAALTWDYLSGNRDVILGPRPDRR